MRKPIVLLVLAGLAVSCGGGSPSQPTPTPFPSPTPAPTPSPTPTPPPPEAEGCNPPLPPPIHEVRVKSQNAGRRKTLDSTPIVFDPAYCLAIGFTDGRPKCPTRIEGSDERVACDALVTGYAEDTGRIGPTWSTILPDETAVPCLSPDMDGKGTVPYCVNHPDNQYKAWAYGPGVFRACIVSGVCGYIEVD